MADEMQERSERLTLKVCSLIVLVVAIAWASVAAMAIYTTQPDLLKMYEAIHIGDLPALVLLMLSPWWALVFVALIAVGVLKEILMTNKKAALLFNVLLLVTVSCLYQLYFWAANHEFSMMLHRLAD
jgi:hypothetical protein